MPMLWRENSTGAPVGATAYVSSGAGGEDGRDGVDGIDGDDGKSAYQIALLNGFIGTEQEWLDSLHNDAVDSVNGQAGVVVLTAANVGADAAGAAATAQAAAISTASSDATTKANAAQAAAIAAAATDATTKANAAAAASQPLDSDLTAFAAKTAPSGAVVGTTDTQTLTNKTLTSPVINTPTGIVKGDVGLGNVDNTSDATKNAASVTLTNKTLTSPAITTPTGIVKGDVGLGNVDNTSDSSKATTEATAARTLTNKTLTSPAITTPTGIVKGDVGLGNVDNTSNATERAATATLTNKTLTSPAITSPTGITYTDVGAAPTNPLSTDTLWSAKGDIAVATANDTASVLSVGTYGTVAIADSTNTTGLAYGAPEPLAHRYLKPTSTYETLPRTSGFADQAVLASGRVSLVAIALPKNLLVTNIAFFSLTTGATGPTHWWFSLCNSSYVTLRSTADQTTTPWSSQTMKNVALSSTFTTTYEGLHYLAIMMAASTPITMTAATQNSTASSGVLPYIGLFGSTGLTTAPADGTNLAPSPTSQNPIMYATVS